MLDSIQTLATSCSFVSEQTHEVNAFICGRNQTSLTASTFKAVNPQLANETVTSESFDDVLSNQQDNNSNWETLRSYLEDNLSDLVLLKTGTIQREVFAVGLSGGRIVGVRSFAVET